MSRSTQYIGLNRYGIELVKDAVRVEQYGMTLGMFDEPVTGNVYYMPLNGHDQDVYKEVTQVEPWSSGPMIFTHLVRYIVKKDQPDDPIFVGNYCSWMLDANVVGEVDYDTGRYYV